MKKFVKIYSWRRETPIIAMRAFDFLLMRLTVDFIEESASMGNSPYLSATVFRWCRA
jgi:hypothetical protein